MNELTTTLLYMLGHEMAVYLEDPMEYKGEKLYWLIEECVDAKGLSPKSPKHPYWTVIDDKGIDISPSRTHGFPSRDLAIRFAAGFHTGAVRVALCEPPLDSNWHPSEEMENMVKARMTGDGVVTAPPPPVEEFAPLQHMDDQSPPSPMERMQALGLELIEGGKKTP